MDKSFVLLLLLAAAWHSASSQDLTRTILTEEPEATGAACLDGTPPGYYMRAGTGDGANKWLLHLFGGGWCNTPSECYDRAQTFLGTSTLWPSTTGGFGMFSNNSALNPDFYNWNVVQFIYCDGGAFSGDKEETETVQGQTLYYRGFRNLEAIIGHLNQVRGMIMATDVILNGCSAGALGVFINADFVQSLVSSTAKYSALADAGYFYNYDLVTGAGPIPLPTIINFALSTHNIDVALPEECKAMYNGTERWRCFFAPYIYEFISTPIFVLNSQYDSLLLEQTIQLTCIPPGCSDAQTQLFLSYKREFDNAVQPVLTSPPTNGYFLESCYIHCHIVENDDAWSRYAINSTTIAQSFGDWYFNRSTETTRLKDCDWPCNPTCPLESAAVRIAVSPYLLVLVFLFVSKLV